MLRIVIALAAIALLVLLGRKLFQNQPSQPGSKTFALPPMGTVVMDSLDIAPKTPLESQPLQVTAHPFLAVIKATPQGMQDTLWLSENAEFKTMVGSVTTLWFFPASNALITLNQDTLYQADPRYTGWGRIQFSSRGVKLSFMR